MLTADEILVWTVRPQRFEATQWEQLQRWLDDGECLQAGRFSHESDRRSYILAHALRRFALSQALQTPPADIAFYNDAHGKPCLSGLLGRRNSNLYFSHARGREGVAFAMTRLAPLGIDVEAYDAHGVDVGVLNSFIALSPEQRRLSEDKSDAGRRFYFYWTVIEAFWKSKGVGLSFAHPPLRCETSTDGLFRLSLQGGSDSAFAIAVPLESPVEYAMTLVIDRPPAHALRSLLQISYQTADFFGAAGLQLPVYGQHGRHTSALIKETEHQA